MIPIPPAVRVWIATGHTDMRRGMNSLAVLVQEAFRRDPRYCSTIPGEQQTMPEGAAARLFKPSS